MDSSSGEIEDLGVATPGKSEDAAGVEKVSAVYASGESSDLGVLQLVTCSTTGVSGSRVCSCSASTCSSLGFSSLCVGPAMSGVSAVTDGSAEVVCECVELALLARGDDISLRALKDNRSGMCSVACSMDV